MQRVETALPAENPFKAIGQSLLDAFLEFGKRRIRSAAQRTDGFQSLFRRIEGHVVTRGYVRPLRRGAELMDAGGKVGDHFLPSLAFGSGNPGIFKAGRVNTHDGQELLEDFQTAAGIEVAGGIMAVAGMAAGNQHAVRTVHQRLENEQRIDAPRTGDADDAQVRRLGGAGRSRRIRPAVGTPVAQKAHDTELFAAQN